MKSLLVLLIFLMALSIQAKDTNKDEVPHKKIQEVNFEDMILKGVIRNPDGLYLVQKKNMKFLPLYDIQKDFDRKIREVNSYTR